MFLTELGRHGGNMKISSISVGSSYNFLHRVRCKDLRVKLFETLILHSRTIS